MSDRILTFLFAVIFKLYVYWYWEVIPFLEDQLYDWFDTNVPPTYAWFFDQRDPLVLSQDMSNWPDCPCGSNAEPYLVIILGDLITPEISFWACRNCRI